MPRSAEWDRVVPGRGGRHWGAFKLLYYHCNTTKIDRVEQPRTACGAEECGVGSSSAGRGWGRHWRVGPSSAGRRRGSVGVPLNDAVVARSAEWEP